MRADSIFWTSSSHLINSVKCNWSCFRLQSWHTVQDMLRQLNMPEYGETGDEFIEAELEMLAMGAKDIPQGSALGEPLLCVCLCAGGAARE